MKKQSIIFYLCLCAAVWSGLQLGKAPLVTTAKAETAANAVSGAMLAAPVCTATVNEVKIQRNPGGNDFGVSWRFPSRCQRSTDTELTITKLNGAQRTDRKKKENGVEIANFSFVGDGDINPVKKARATITSSGVLAAKGTLTVSLGFSSGVGSNAPVDPPTFTLNGVILNTQTNTPLTGVRIDFQLAGSAGGRQIASVETNAQGRWVQNGFPVGRSVIVTASKRFFVIEPATRIVSAGGTLDFKGSPNDVGAPAPTPNGGTFSAGGVAKVDDLAQGTQAPLIGATISFSVQNANGKKPNIPGPVATQSKGNWSQSGFTVGVMYKASISKTGVTFAFSTALFSGNSPGQVVNDVGFLGTIAGTPPPASAPFSAGGKVNVFSTSQGTTTPLAGATITFKLQNPATAGSANVPAPVTTQSNGSWSQSGFTGGVKYIATITKAGVSFGDVAQQINGPSQAINFLGRVQ